MQEKFSRRRLPHLDRPGATYFITTCLEGSIPAEGLLALQTHRRDLEKRERRADISPEEWRVRNWKLMFAETDRWLDLAGAVRHLEDPRLAKEVVSALQYWQGKRIDLIAWVVMPSHVHWLFTPLLEWERSLGDDADKRSPRERIEQSVNRHTARQCNTILGTSGQFWQHESYDHCVRDEAELQRIIDYIHLNPVKAGLVERAIDFPFSSARLYYDIERGASL